MAEAAKWSLGAPALFTLGVNGIVGVGIFFAPAGVAAEVPGQTGVLVYAVTVLALLPIALGYAALGRRFPIDGGPYVWARAAFGPGFGFMVGWLTYVSSLFSLAAVISGLSHHAGPLFGVDGPTGTRLFAMGCLSVLVLVACSGLRPSAMVWSAVTVLKLIPLVLVAGLGALALSEPAQALPVSDALTVVSLERAVLVLVFACQGFEVVPILAGSVRRPERAVPLATVGALVFAGVLYAMLHWVSVRAVPDLGRSSAPLVDAARAYGGSVAASVVAAGANVSALGIAFGMVNTTPRYLMALSAEPAIRRLVGAGGDAQSPVRALLGTAVLVALLVLGSSHLTALFVLSSLAVLAQYTAVLASLFVLSRRGERGLRKRDAWVVPLSLVGIGLAARGAEEGEVAVALGVILGGALLLWLGRRLASAPGVG